MDTEGMTLVWLTPDAVMIMGPLSKNNPLPDLLPLGTEYLLFDPAFPEQPKLGNLIYSVSSCVTVSVSLEDLPSFQPHLSMWEYIPVREEWNLRAVQQLSGPCTQPRTTPFHRRISRRKFG